MKYIVTALLLCTQFSLTYGQGRGDSITVAIAPAYDEVGKTHRTFLGENYRKLWATPVKVRVLHLAKEQGGLSIVKLGGGNQTRSLRLVDKQGKEWVLRTIQKYPERGLPENLRPTIAKNIVQDQVSTGHPFGAVIVPPLAEALQIPHANPEIVYVGDDPGLGEYRQDFANAVYLFEEREPLDAGDTDNTLKVQKELLEDNDHRVEQRSVLRARLLDFVVGDWDRHEDNWRWLKEKDKEGTLYTAIPRDRDKVFYKTSGIFPWILSHQWLKSNLQPYAESIRDVNGWNYNARFFDRYFLTALSEADWREEIALVQQRLTPALVHQSLTRMPRPIYEQSAAALERIMNARVEHLEESAMEYYRFLAKTVEIPFSDKREQFTLVYEAGGMIAVEVRNIKKDGSIGRKLYERRFDPSATEEIRLYGFDSADHFVVKGTAPSDIKVRLVGGAGKDVFEIDPDFANRKRLFIYDRSDEGNVVPVGNLAKLRLANDTLVNSFNKTSFMFDRFGPQFRASYSFDQGFQIGAGLIYEKQGFRKDPYAVKHDFWVTYATGRKSFMIDYQGDSKQVIGDYDFRIDATSLGPHNLSNFFGLGNETVFEDTEEKEMSYYRNRYDLVNADFKLARSLGDHLRIEGGLSTAFYTSNRSSNVNRFLGDFAAANPNEQVFSDRFYGGLVANLIYDTRDQHAMPSSGVWWRTSLSYQHELGGVGNEYGKLQSEIRYYVKAGSTGLVIANRLGGGTTFGAPAFFQKMQLGGVRNLRGFHSIRYTGKSMAYYNLDLRMKLFSFTSYIVPGSVGLLAFNDIGRVWEPGERSNQWHDGYGGGLYIIPAELLLIQGAVGFSREGALPYISIGFSF